MSIVLRSMMLGSALAGLAACASNPAAPDRAPIDYRTVAPSARVSTPAPASRTVPAPASLPRVVDTSVSPNAMSAIDEAKALAAESGSRPGGALRQPKDSKAKRAVEVLRRDTLYDISRRYSVNMRALIETNRLEPPYALDTGSVIYLPPPNIHVIERGETLYSVSRRYNVDTRSLALLNGMARPWTVWPGDELVLPPLARDQGRKVVVAAPSRAAAPAAKPLAAPSLKPPPAKPPATAGAQDDAPIALKPIPKSPPKPVSAPTGEPKKAATTSKGDADFIWPVSGPVLKGFGTGEDGLRNDGVNISVPAGTKVAAAAAGEVVYAGNELSGFGNLVLIRHPGGWVSAYAHAETLLVKEGDLVIQGQPVAEAGATGNAESPQVHFELRKGKEPVDPTEHLPTLRG
jgi:murein DD-endopeptidase MepM/ murein hydrolase activator NlpD